MLNSSGAREFLRQPAAPIAMVSSSGRELVAMAIWLAHTGTDGLLLPVERLIPTVYDELRERGYRIVILDDGSVTEPIKPAAPHPGRITLLTSGTTGMPKFIEHTWQSLFTMGRARNLKSLNWLLTYQPGTYAWFQLVTLIIFSPGQSLTIPADRNPVVFIETALRQGVSAISATPTFWRMALMQFPHEALRNLALQQITLGGERVDQEILDQLRQLFPQAVLTHIYASSEAGACIVVRDGREGFPVVWLSDGDALREGPQLQVRDGMLWIRSPHASAQHGGWFRSGDAVEVRNDRVFILGRADHALINVGGLKVAVRDVERRLLQHPFVLWCRVYGRPAPLMGELVAADIVPRMGANISETELTTFCAGKLSETMVPRLWRFLPQIPATENLKTELV